MGSEVRTLMDELGLGGDLNVSPLSNQRPETGQDSLTGVLEEIVGQDFLAGQSLAIEITAENETNPESQKWEPTELRPRHREILRRVLEGANHLQIAEAMGIHKQTVMLVTTSKLFRAELAKLEMELDGNVIRRADDLSNEALDQIKVLMRAGKTQQIQLRAAERILDTAGYSKIEKKMIGVVRGEDVIKELLKRRREKAEEANINLNPDSEVLNVNRAN